MFFLKALMVWQEFQGNVFSNNCFPMHYFTELTLLSETDWLYVNLISFPGHREGLEGTYRDHELEICFDVWDAYILLYEYNVKL